MNKKKKLPSLFEISAKSIVEHFCKICRDLKKSPCCHHFHNEVAVQSMAKHFKDLRNLIQCGQKEARWRTYFEDVTEDDDNKLKEDEVRYWFWLCFENSEAQELNLCLPTKTSQMVFNHIQRSRFQLFNAKKLHIHMEVTELNIVTSDKKGQNAMRNQSMMTALVPTVHEFRNFFKKFPKIEELDIDIDAGTIQADLLAKVLWRLNKLRRLKITLFEDEIEQFAKFIDRSKSQKSLTQIELSTFKSDSDLNETVFKSLKKLPNLASLLLWGHSITDSAIKRIKKLRLESLRHLEVDQYSSELMKLEETFPNVQKIELSIDDNEEPFVDFDKSNFCTEKLKRVSINCHDYPLDSLFFKNFPNIEVLDYNEDDEPNFSNLGETEVKSLKKMYIYTRLEDKPKFLLKFPNLEEFYVGIDPYDPHDEDYDGLSETDLQECNDFVKKLLPYLPEKCQILDSHHKERLIWCRKTSKLVMKE